MLKAFLLTFLAISATRQACNEGCLKCSASGECLLADISANYYLNGTTATKIILDNCHLNGHDGKCVNCYSKYYPDGTTGKCVAVPTANLIANCDIYYNATSCMACVTDYYLNANLCVAVETKIANCHYYSGTASCAVCNSNYLLSLDSKSCVVSPNINNCSDFTFVKCNTCESGYVLNPNNYLQTLPTGTTATDKDTMAAFAYALNSDADLVAQAACQVESTANCSAMDQGTNTCSACLIGYYLDEKNMCIVYPDEPIENCLHYSGLASCNTCNANYYFKSGVCTLIEGTAVIANCSLYNNSASSVQCTTCAANYYLSNNGCVIRDKSADQKIADCATKDISADRCAVCASGKILSSDGLECFTAIDHCKTYHSTAAGQTLKCNFCAAGFYLQTTTVDNQTVTTCPAGNVLNCDEYQAGSADVCILCANGFLLQNNACVAHNTIAGCTVYSTSTLHTCNVCTHTVNFNFLIEERCQDIPEANKIANCSAYTGTLASPNCETCNSGYYLTNNTCPQITIANCSNMDGTECTSCTTGYALSHNDLACITVPGYINDKCSQNSTKDTANTEHAVDVTCDVCTENAIPYNFDEHYVCMSTAETREVIESTDDTHIISNCIKYDENVECVQCGLEGNKYLNKSTNPPSCVIGCDDYYHKYLIDSDNQLSQFNVCGDLGIAVTKTPVTNCEVYAPDVSSNGNHICVKCKSTFMPVIDVGSTKYTNIDPSATTLDNFFPSPHARYPEIDECYQTIGTTQISGVTTQTLISNCSYYYNIAANSYACFRCDQGFTGTINANNYIGTCTRDSKCTTDRYHNLHPFINAISSCHKCTNTTEIPFIAYANDDDELDNVTFETFARYATTKSGLDFADAAGTEKNIACRSPSNTTFGIAANDFDLPQNCGMAVIIVNTNGTTDNTDDFGTFCAACKPSYMPTYHNTLSYVVTGCTQIDHCKSDTKFFNGCSDCDTGYILKYTTANDAKILYDACLTVPSSLTAKLANCYAAEVGTGTNASNCQVCKRGYQLNLDGFCEQYQPYQCKTNSFRPNFDLDSDTWGWSLYIQRTTVGCSECNNGYHAVKLTSSKTVCLSSTWITSSVDALTIDATVYIPHCKNYIANHANILCNTCDASYVIKGDSASNITNDECFVNTSIANCEIASSATVCLKCNSVTYGLQNNKCVLGNIANCVAYNSDTNEATVKCNRCESNYYLNTTTNSCVLGEIHNCKILENNNSKGCVTCNDNYTLVPGILNDFDYCYPNDSSLGCAVTEINSGSLGGAVNCASCINVGTQLPAEPATDANQTICMAFAPIANCNAYNIGATLSASNFNCNLCNAGYYLSNNRCVVRINQPAKCTEYHVSKDECSKCDNTSYLADSNKKCTDYPKGILGCSTYSNATTCTSCKSERYLDNNACPKVPTPITNCLYYSSRTACSTCSTGYYLNGNTCVKATATNCATFTSETVCATCPSGYVLETTSSVTNCVAKTKTGCATININTPYDCTQCSGTYYLDAGDCKTPNTITNCVAYDSKTTCSKCSQGYALSSDKTSCTNTGATAAYIDARCTDSQIVSTAVCSRCNAGFYFVNGECTGTCPTGCLACDPDTKDSCLICKTGFYQSANANCNANATNTSNAMIMGVMTILVALFSVMFQISNY